MKLFETQRQLKESFEINIFLLGDMSLLLRKGELCHVGTESKVGLK